MEEYFNDSSIKTVKFLPHHQQKDLCQTRPQYRQGRKLTAVKVYTVNDESQYLIISGIPDIKIGRELTNMCIKFGKLNCVYPLADYPSDKFELTYLVKYVFIRSARKAKKILDGKSFFGGVLHVCYAPELESIEETKEKLIERRKSISFQNKKLGRIFSTNLNENNIGDKIQSHKKVFSTYKNKCEDTIKSYSSDINLFKFKSHDIIHEERCSKPELVSEISNNVLTFHPNFEVDIPPSNREIIKVAGHNIKNVNLLSKCEKNKNETYCFIDKKSDTSICNFPNTLKKNKYLKRLSIRPFSQPSMDILRKPIKLEKRISKSSLGTTGKP